MADKRTTWVDLFVSSRISTTEGTGIELLREEIDNLVNKSEEVNPEGKVVISIFHKVERIRPISNVMTNLNFAERYYPNAIAFGNAEVSREWIDLLGHIEAINKIISKRRKEYYKHIKAKNTKKHKDNETKNSEIDNQ